MSNASRSPERAVKVSRGGTAITDPDRRRTLVTLARLGLLAPWLALAGCGSEPLRVGLHVWPGYEFLPVAQERGWFDGQGIELIETRDATHTQELFVAGAIDAAALPLGEVLRLQASGLPLRVALVFNISVGADALLAGKQVPRVAALKGRRIAVEPGGVGLLVLQAALASAGLSGADVSAVSMPVDQHARALASGSVDAAISYEPQAGLLEAAGYRRLFDSSAMPETIFDVLAVRAERISRRKVPLAGLIAAHFRAQNAFRRNPNDVAFAMAAHLSLPGQSVHGAFGGLFLPGVAENRRLLSASGPARSPLDVASSRLRTLIGLARSDSDRQAGFDLALADFLPPSGV